MQSLADRLHHESRVLLLDKPGWVYAIKNDYFPGMVKIGMSRISADRRIKNMSTAYPNDSVVVAQKLVCHAKRVEQLLHLHFASTRVNPSREFFTLTDQEIIDAIALCGEILPAGADVGKRLLKAHFPKRNRKAPRLAPSSSAVS